MHLFFWNPGSTHHPGSWLYWLIILSCLYSLYPYLLLFILDTQLFVGIIWDWVLQCDRLAVESNYINSGDFRLILCFTNCFNLELYCLKADLIHLVNWTGMHSPDQALEKVKCSPSQWICIVRPVKWQIPRVSFFALHMLSLMHMHNAFTNNFWKVQFSVWATVNYIFVSVLIVASSVCYY